MPIASAHSSAVIQFQNASVLGIAFSAEVANRILHHCGPDKFMFGTDFPMWDAEKELERFMRLNLSGKELEDVLYNNFRRLFG